MSGYERPSFPAFFGVGSNLTSSISNTKQRGGFMRTFSRAGLFFSLAAASGFVLAQSQPVARPAAPAQAPTLVAQGQAAPAAGTAGGAASGAAATTAGAAAAGGAGFTIAVTAAAAVAAAAASASGSTTTTTSHFTP